MKIVCAGTPMFATDIFEYLHKIHQILCIVSQPDKPFGRKAELKPPHTKEIFAAKGIPIFQPTHIDNDFVARIKALNPDFIVVVAYGKILPKAFLDIAPCINIHASILPKYRGASPLQQMILKQERYFGVTAMLMNEKLDSGDILGISYLSNTQQNIIALSKELALCGGKLAAYVLSHFASIQPLRQIDADANYCKKIHKMQGCMRFESAVDIYRAYLAYCVWPHIFIQSTRGYILKLFDITLIESTKTHRAGEILDIESQSLTIGCAQGSVRVAQVQQEGKGRISAAVYARGKHLHVGDVLC